MAIDPDRYHVAVDGGDLAVARWGDGDAVVLAAHGITASHVAWSAVGEEVARELTLLAPDLRGRGDSAAVRGPSSMERHARDLAAVADHAKARRVVVAGHSMGGFVAVAFADLYPDRTRGAVLVDGGPALGAPLPAEVDVDAVLAQVVGPAVGRLDRRWTSRDEHRRFWREHPAFADSDVAPDRIDAYADHDVHGPAGALRSKVVADVVRQDARDTLTNRSVFDALGRVRVPAVLLLAERGMLDQDTPLYPPAAVEGLRTARGPLEVIRVPDTNHYTIGLGAVGARAVARQLRRFAGEDDA